MRGKGPRRGAARYRSRPLIVGAAVATTAVVIVAAVIFVNGTNMRPAYDAFGWLVWGKQALHWNLNTNGAPSWKPLTFLFTYPYALAGAGQMRLWMITSVAAAFAGSVFAARIAFRLTAAETNRSYAPYVAALLAAAAVLGLDGYWPLILISNSDPMVVTLCLAAIDAHVCRRPALAFAALTLAALGRPEVWPFMLIYAIWVFRAYRHWGMRIYLLVGLALIPLLWFGIPALTANSWFAAGNVALNPKLVLHGNRWTGTWKLFFGLYPTVVWIAALLALVFAAIRRDRTSLLLFAGAVGWVLIEFGFILHKWPAQNRYLTEPAAVVAVLAAVGLGRLLALGERTNWGVRLASVAVVAVIVALAIPTAENRVDVASAAVVQRRDYATRLDRLEALIRLVGGAHRIRSCGQPTAIVGLQSALAYELDMNVGFVGHKPARLIHRHTPIVLFKPDRLGWVVIPINTERVNVTRCATLLSETNFGPGATDARLLPLTLVPAAPIRPVHRHHHHRRHLHHRHRLHHRRRHRHRTTHRKHRRHHRRRTKR
jgi:hypothetical protein